MSFADERRAIESRLAANWTTTSIKWENRKFVQPASAWIALTILSGSGEAVSVGGLNTLHRHAGVIQIDIYVPEFTGTQATRAYADTIDTIFREVQFSAGSSGTITCRVPDYRSLGATDGWHRSVLSIAYKRDRVR